MPLCYTVTDSNRWLIQFLIEYNILLSWEIKAFLPWSHKTVNWTVGFEYSQVNSSVQSGMKCLMSLGPTISRVVGCKMSPLECATFPLFTHRAQCNLEENTARKKSNDQMVLVGERIF